MMYASKGVARYAPTAALSKDKIVKGPVAVDEREEEYRLRDVEAAPDATHSGRIFGSYRIRRAVTARYLSLWPDFATFLCAHEKSYTGSIINQNTR
jgi:hypothetical protein